MKKNVSTENAVVISGLPMLLFINEIDFKAFGPFNDVDGTDVKLFRAMFKS